FLHTEWLGQVVVGAGVYTLNPLGPGTARGQDQNRTFATLGPPALEHGQPVKARQVQIQHDQVVILGAAAKPRCLAIGHQLDKKPRRFQRAFQIRGNPQLILNHKGAHQSSSSSSSLSSSLMMVPVLASVSTSISRPSVVMSSTS